MGNRITTLCDEQTDTRPTKSVQTRQKLTVYGDYFNSETRTILAVLKIAGDVQYDYVNFNSLTDEQREGRHAFEKINPSFQLPVVVEGSYKILNGNNAALTYLSCTHISICEKLAPKSSQKQIMQCLNFLQSAIQPVTSRLTTLYAKHALNLQNSLQVS